MSYTILDIETESREYRNRTADALEPSNLCVMRQWKYENNQEVIVEYNNGKDLRLESLPLNSTSILIGQNFKFDLLYLWNNSDLQHYLKNGGMVWDTMTVEYLINHCRPHFGYSLKAIAERYKAPINKYDKVSALYDEGKTTLQIIELLGLDEYLIYAKADCLATEYVFLKQYMYVKTHNLWNLIKFYMDYYISICEMEFNGLHVNTDLQNNLIKQITDNLDPLKEICERVIKEQNLWTVPGVEFNINSNSHLSYLIFGGSLKGVIREPIIDNGLVATFKTGKQKGQVKYKNTQQIISNTGMIKDKTLMQKMPKKNEYKVGYHEIKAIYETCPTQFFKALFEYKSQYKLYSDMTKRYYETLNPHTNCIHSEFNTTSTATGRLSSSKPGVQNLHPKVLQIIQSRWKEDGIIIEFDWNQLEVCVAAYKFKDKTLEQEILNGVDLHKKNATFLYNKSEEEITKAERKIAKFATFKILYGGGYKSLALAHNLDEEVAKNYIDMFFMKYTGIAWAHNQLISNIKESIAYDENKKAYAIIPQQNGKSYYFSQYKKDNGKWEFNFCQAKNYPIQGTAGDLHAYCTGKLFREFLINNREKGLLINNVHDSILFDVKKIYKDWWISEVKHLMETYAKHSGVNYFTLDVKYGNSWGECKND